MLDSKQFTKTAEYSIKSKFDQHYREGKFKCSQGLCDVLESFRFLSCQKKLLFGGDRLSFAVSPGVRFLVLNEHNFCLNKKNYPV